MGCCKSRQTVAKGAKQIEKNVQYHQEDTSAKASAKAWARLRNEASLNPDAEPFMPRAQPREASDGPRSRSRAQPRAEGSDLSAKQVRAQRSITRPQAQPQVQSQPDVKLDASFAASFALRTCEYKKLLQDGGASGVQDGAKLNTAPWRRDKPAAPSTGPVLKMAPTAAPPTSQLGQLVKSAFVESAPMNNNDNFDLEGCLHTKPRQFADDTFLERFLDSRDYSDQAYFSDGGDGKFPAPLGRSARKPSAHRFRRVDVMKRSTRSYVMQDLSVELDRVTSLLLGQLQFFQQLEVLDREPDPVSTTHDHRTLRRMGKQTKALPPNRRFFVGLKEVTRRVRQSLVKVIVIAPDLDSSIDDRMRDFLALAYQNEVPVIFALTRKLIGKAVGKNLDFSIMGVVDVTGAQSLFDEAVGLAWDQQLTWLHREEIRRQGSNSAAPSRK